MIDIKVLNNVRSIRINKGLSIRDLAKKAKVNKNTVDKVEKGLSIPNHYTILKISRALDMEVHEVFDMNWRNKPYL